MKVQGAMITRVNKTAVSSSNNIAITMNNGDVHWVNLKYVNAILSSMFLDGASPKALEGSTVSYEKRVHKAGDKVTDEDGTVVKNADKTDKVFTKDGIRIFSFRVEEEGAKAESLHQVGFKIAKKLSLSGSLSTIALPKKKAVEGTDTAHGAKEQQTIADNIKSAVGETVNSADVA